MIKYFTYILGIDYIPRWLLYHLMFFSLALGGFQAILFVGSVSGFVSANMLAYFPEAIAFSGLLGIILYNFYKYIIRNFSFRKASSFFYLLVAFIIFLAIFLPYIFPGLTTSVLFFIIFIPITLLSEQFIAGLSDRVPFQNYQQNLKRYCEAIYIVGSVVFSVGITLGAAIGIKPYIFIPAMVLLGFAALESNFILKKLDIKKIVEEEPIESVIYMFSDLPLKSNVLAILFFLFLSVINFICIDYVFIDNLSKTYVNTSSLIQFLGIFSAGFMSISFLFKLFVYQNLIKTFHIHRALFLSPVFMIIAMVLLNILLYLQSHVYWRDSTIYLFMIIVFARFFAGVFRESFELNSVRLIFSAISTYSKKIISNNTYNIFSIWGYLFIGLILLLIMSFDMFHVKTIIYLNSVFVVLWMFASIMLEKKYIISLEKIVHKLSTFTLDNSKQKNLSFKDRVMITSNLSGLKYLLNFQKYYQPFDFAKELENIPVHIQDELGLIPEVIDAQNSLGRIDKMANSPTEKNIGMNFYDSDQDMVMNDVEALASSTKFKDRVRAVHMIERSQNPTHSGIFKMLVRDSDPEVRRNALMSAVSYHSFEILSEVIKYIKHEEFSTLASEVLAKIGNESIPLLSVLFHRKETDLKVQLQIVKIVGKISSPEAVAFLKDKLNYPNKWIILETVSALNEHKINPDFRHSKSLHQAIFKTIGVLAWLLSKEVSIAGIRKSDPLKKALEDEYQLTFDLLFNLLELKYQNGLIKYVNSNFGQHRTNEQKELYVELFSCIMDEDIKVQLFPLLHNNQKTEKLKQLKQFFPIERKDIKSAVKDLLNADYGSVSIWTRACALKFYLELEDNLESEEVVAQVFNPELMIAELAFFGIYKKSPQSIGNISSRLPSKLKNRIVSVLKQGVLYEHCLTFNKVIALQKISYFHKLMGHNLVPFAEILSEIFLGKNDSTYLKCSKEEVLPVFFEPFGEISLIDSHKRRVRLTQNYLYGLGLYAGGVTLDAFSDSVLYIAQPEQIGYLVIHYEELSDALFKYIQNSNFY